MHRFIRTTLAVALALSCAQLATAADESLKGRAEASFAHTSGNTDTRTLAAQIKGSYEAGVNRFFLRGAALYGKTEGVETSNRWLAEGRYERAITERFFAFLETSYFKDKFAGFDSKIQAGPGVGYDVIKTDRQILKLLVSALYTWDNYTDGTDDAYATGKAAGDYAWQITDTLTFKQYADYLVSVDDTSMYFVNALTGLEVKVAANISLGLSYLVAYQNEPPPGAEHADRTFLSSLIVDF